MGHNLPPLGVVGRQGAGQTAVSNAFLQCGHNFGKRDSDGGAADAFDEVTQSGGIRADLLAFEFRQRDRSLALVAHVAPQLLGRPRIDQQKLGIELILQFPLHDRPVGLRHFTVNAQILCQACKVSAFDSWAVLAGIGRQAVRRVIHAELQQPHHFIAGKAQFRVRLGIGGQRTFRASGRVLFQKTLSRSFQWARLPQVPTTLNSFLPRSAADAGSAASDTAAAAASAKTVFFILSLPVLRTF